MNSFDDLLGDSGTDIGALGSQFGLSPEQTQAAMGALMPAILGGFQKKAEAGDLGGLANIVEGIQNPAVATNQGNDILGQIFGSKDVSRQVAAHAAGKTGISDTILKAMLPIIAATVGRSLTKRLGGGLLGGLAGTVLASVLAGQGGGGGLGNILGGGGSASPFPQDSGTVAGSGGIGDLGGLGGLGSLLDRDGDGNPLDDILGGLTGRS